MIRELTLVSLLVSAGLAVPLPARAQARALAGSFWSVTRAPARPGARGTPRFGVATPAVPDLRAVGSLSVRTSVSVSQVAAFPARRGWNGTDTGLGAAFVVTLLLDAGATRAVARGGWVGFREANPVLGSRPSVARVNAYTALVGVGVLGAAAAAPRRLRPWILGAALAVEALTVTANTRGGAPLRIF